MKLLAINASPRGKASNTKRLLDYFTKDMHQSSVNIVHLKEFYDKENFPSLLEQTAAYDYILIGFPLYADWTPGFVKEFLEFMGQNRESFKNKNLLFLIQCGFPESHHCRYVEQYCQRFTRRLGSHYAGSIVRGGSEGARLIPKKFFKDAQRLSELGKVFETEKQLDEQLLKTIAHPEKLTGFSLLRMKLMLKSPFANLYWNAQLKKNGVFKNRFDKPYQQ